MQLREFIQELLMCEIKDPDKRNSVLEQNIIINNTQDFIIAYDEQIKAIKIETK